MYEYAVPFQGYSPLSRGSELGNVSSEIKQSVEFFCCKISKSLNLNLKFKRKNHPIDLPQPVYLKLSSECHQQNYFLSLFDNLSTMG